MKVTDYGTYEILGRTRDDAAGEAFDKVARAIGWDIREDQKLKKFPMKEIRRQFPFRGQRLQMGYMISVSVD